MSSGTRLAGLYVTDGAETNSVEAMEQLRQWTIAADSGVDAQLGTDAIQIKVPGIHFAQAVISFMGTAGVTYYAELRVNGASIGERLIVGQYVDTSNKLYNLVVIGAGRLNEGDLVSIYVGSDAVGGANFRMVYGQFGVMSL